MRVSISTEACIGCCLCADACPTVFDMEEDIAIVTVAEVPEDDEDCVEEAAEGCPVDAIILDE
jgi:ferredoxin